MKGLKPENNKLVFKEVEVERLYIEAFRLIFTLEKTSIYINSHFYVIKTKKEKEVCTMLQQVKNAQVKVNHLVKDCPVSPKKKLQLFFKIKHRRPLNYPRYIWIEITNECNLRCIMCPQSRGLNRKKMTMTRAAFKKIIDQVYINRPTIMLHHAGEPLLNENVFSMIKYANTKGCKTALHTNATLLTKKMSIRILQSSLDYISFSFDGCSPEIYEKLRVGANFEHVKSQIETFLELRDEMKIKRPRTQIEIILMKETEKKVSDFVEYWKTKKVDKIGIRIVTTWFDLVDDHRVVKVQDFDFGHRYCKSIFWGCVILVDGTIVPCCKDFTGQFPLGNIFTQPFNEVWNGTLYNRLRKQHLTNTIPANSICHSCAYTKCWSKKDQVAQWFLKHIFWRKINMPDN